MLTNTRPSAHCAICGSLQNDAQHSSNSISPSSELQPWSGGGLSLSPWQLGWEVPFVYEAVPLPWHQPCEPNYTALWARGPHINTYSPLRSIDQCQPGSHSPEPTVESQIKHLRLWQNNHLSLTFLKAPFLIRIPGSFPWQLNTKLFDSLQQAAQWDLRAAADTIQCSLALLKKRQKWNERQSHLHSILLLWICISNFQIVWLFNKGSKFLEFVFTNLTLIALL